MFTPRQIISYLEMCNFEGVNLQRGMNFRLHDDNSIFLMSQQKNAPYPDKVSIDGRTIIYEGHDVSKTQDTPIPKNYDQPMQYPSGTLTQNGLFYSAAKEYQKTKIHPEAIRVYEKIHAGIWVYNGVFNLTDAWQEKQGNRTVFKFQLELDENRFINDTQPKEVVLEHSRMIPPNVKLAVWKRDKGKCVICGRSDNLHFDHIIPFSKGGSSLIAKNVQLLCARHNIAKRDNIE